MERSRIFVAVCIMLAFAASSSAKARFASLPEMIAEADAIALVDIEAVHAMRPEQEGLTCKDMVAEVKLDKVIVGKPGELKRINIPCFFPCAIVSVKPGPYLVFLKNEKGVMTNSNWDISLRPVEPGGIQWFDDLHRRKPPTIPLETIFKKINEIRKRK